MRVAQRSVSRNYKRTLNNSLAKRAESLDRGSSGLKFKKLSDNVADGSRAMHIQEERYQATQQLDNVENLLSEMNSVDSNMEAIHSIMQSIQEKTLQAMSESYGADKRAVLAKEIAKKKEEILQFANAQFSGKYLFSGTKNSTQPFTAGPNGELQFNGIPVNTIEKNADGKFVYPDPNAPGNMLEVPNSGSVYADIGLGLKISPDMDPDPRTAFEVSFSGLEMLGFGADKTGKDGTAVPSNVYDLLTQIENAITPDLKQPDTDDLHRQLVDLTDNVGLSRTDLGTRMNFLERAQSRLENDVHNMSELESKLVSSDPAEEAIKMKESEYVWMAVLQIGSKVLPSSLLDFMR